MWCLLVAMLFFSLVYDMGLLGLKEELNIKLFPRWFSLYDHADIYKTHFHIPILESLYSQY